MVCMINRDGYTVEVSTIEKVEWHDEGCYITRAEPGWGTFAVGKDELKGFEPQEGDVIVVYTKGFSTIRGITIDGLVLRYTTPAQAEAEHEQRKRNNRLKQLERYIAEGDALKARAAALPLPLLERMERFAEKGGVEFWIDSAEYEMYALEGAAALLRKVRELGFIHSDHANFGVAEGENDDIEGAVRWIKDWWELNTEKHGYDYSRQMELVPDFGDGHSGNTASAAYALAVRILEGGEV